MNARLDYCNVLHYYGVSARNVQQLQRIRNLLVSYATYRIIDLPLIHSRLFTGYDRDNLISSSPYTKTYLPPFCTNSIIRLF